MNTQLRHPLLQCALFAAVMLLLITDTKPMIESLIGHADVTPPPRQNRVEGRYLPAPGNRTACPDVNAKGERYVGWISGQADGSNNPVKTACIYASARDV